VDAVTVASRLEQFLRLLQRSWEGIFGIVDTFRLG
jgi:hypothetical protein